MYETCKKRICIEIILYEKTYDISRGCICVYEKGYKNSNAYSISWIAWLSFKFLSRVCLLFFFLMSAVENESNSYKMFHYMYEIDYFEKSKLIIIYTVYFFKLGIYLS